MNKQAGFTLVELVVVIIILGILAATALPRFMNVQDEAHSAAVAGAGGGLGSGVAMARAQWVANGGTAADIDVDNFGDGSVDVNDNGWPVGTAAASGSESVTDHTGCVEVWRGVMQNPPTVAETGSTTADDDYEATRSTATVGADTHEICTYDYLGDGGTMNITYNAFTGEVTVTN